VIVVFYQRLRLNGMKRREFPNAHLVRKGGFRTASKII
jgi:hypothetical protein